MAPLCRACMLPDSGGSTGRDDAERGQKEKGGTHHWQGISDELQVGKLPGDAQGGKQRYKGEGEPAKKHEDRSGFR